LGLRLVSGYVVLRILLLNCDDPELVEGEEAMPSGNSFES
jgi:hypothetical protein